MDARRARFISSILGGRERGRIFYYVLSTGALVFCVLLLFGIVEG